MANWLDTFVYQILLRPTRFVFAGLITLLIAIAPSPDRRSTPLP